MYVMMKIYTYMYVNMFLQILTFIFDAQLGA